MYNNLSQIRPEICRRTDPIAKHPPSERVSVVADSVFLTPQAINPMTLLSARRHQTDRRFRRCSRVVGESRGHSAAEDRVIYRTSPAATCSTGSDQRLQQQQQQQHFASSACSRRLVMLYDLNISPENCHEMCEIRPSILLTEYIWFSCIKFYGRNTLRLSFSFYPLVPLSHYPKAR